ncbi:MAG: sensor histidine kinase [Christensenellales bacterium]
MKLTNKLTILIVFICMILLLAFTAFERALFQKSQMQSLNQSKQIVQQAVDVTDHEVSWMSTQLASLASYQGTNLANMYAKLDMFGNFIEYGRIIQARLSLMQNSVDTVSYVKVIMLEDRHEISSKTLYQELTDDDYSYWSSILSHDRKIINRNDEIILCQELASAKATGNSYAVASFSVQKLFDKFVKMCGERYRFDLYLGDELLCTSGDDINNTYCLLEYPIEKLTENKSTPLNLYISTEKISYDDTVFKQFYIGLGLFTLIILICLILMVTVCRYLVHHPLKKILVAFELLCQGDTSVRIQTKRTDEFSQLYINFNEMAMQLERVIGEKISAQLKRLQGQINPHFLHNGFYQIYRMCKDEDLQGAAEMSMQLSRFYEFINDEIINDQFVLLEKEYQHALTYCIIQRIRFEDQFILEAQPLPETLRQFKVPSLIIQPVLENIFSHVLGNTPDTKIRIRVTFEQKENIVFLKVENNGKQLSESELNAMCRNLNTYEHGFAHSSLTNIHVRLRMAMGEKAGIELKHSTLGGLLVVLVLVEI